MHSYLFGSWPPNIFTIVDVRILGVACLRCAVGIVLAMMPVRLRECRRASQLRSIVAELRKVCSHPALLPEYAPAAEDASGVSTPAGTPSVKVEGTATSIPSSGKLRLMMQLLPALHASGHRVLVLSQSQKVRDRFYSSH